MVRKLSTAVCEAVRASSNLVIHPKKLSNNSERGLTRKPPDLGSGYHEGAILSVPTKYVGRLVEGKNGL